MTKLKFLFYFSMLTVLVYLPSFQAAFQLDDYVTIVDNSIMHQVKHMSKLWYFDPSRFLVH
ncbi:MAG: hypothetical protein ACI8Q2_000549, partial [Candidatus Omnitrophota bacterium]